MSTDPTNIATRLGFTWEYIFDSVRIIEDNGGIHMADITEHKLVDEVERLRDILEKIADNAARETNGKKEYSGDTYGYILKLAKEGIE